MKFIIGKGARKREIEGPFGMCGSREDFVQLIRSLQETIGNPKTEREESHGWFQHGITYGWLNIVELPSEMPPNCVPEPWDNTLS
jgi:hypothetical protein